MKTLIPLSIAISLMAIGRPMATADELSMLENADVRVGIDLKKGAAITWLSGKDYPKNMVNIADPGRLIQQSYYAGRRLNRTHEGQSTAWSPWPWNPIQGGGVGSWAQVIEHRREANLLYAETIPKLWDMPNEEAAAFMRQWTSLEPSMPNVVVVKCELVCRREASDNWGPSSLSPQEIPACYFTRNFDQVKSYLGDGRWRDESQPPGPPWGKANPPRKAMACFDGNGQGVAIFSPSSTQPWNFGPHGQGRSRDPLAASCIHIAPLDRVLLGPKSTYSYRYWLVVGAEASITARLDSLWEKYAMEETKLAN